MNLLEKYPTGLQLRGDVLVVEEDSALSLVKEKKVSFKNLSESERDLLRSLREGISGARVRELAAEPRIMKLLELLEQQQFLKTWIETSLLSSRHGRTLDWLSHFTSAPLLSLAALQSKRVLVVGCGGTGAVVAEHLVRAGLAAMVLIDSAEVDLPDLNRQLAYFPADVGRPKAELLRERLLRLNPELDCEALHLRVTSSASLTALLTARSVDLIINCADTPVGLIHSWVSEASLALETPCLFGGVGLGEATVGPLLTSPAAKQAYATASRDVAELLAQNQNILKASLPFTNSLVAVKIAFEAFKYLSDLDLPRVGEQAVNFEALSL
jgi:hypothetical protein